MWKKYFHYYKINNQSSKNYQVNSYVYVKYWGKLFRLQHQLPNLSLQCWNRIRWWSGILSSYFSCLLWWYRAQNVFNTRCHPKVSRIQRSQFTADIWHLTHHSGDSLRTRDRICSVTSPFQLLFAKTKECSDKMSMTSWKNQYVT